MLTEGEVFAIDNRIISCIVENPDSNDEEYYCKIFFQYQLTHRLDIELNGRIEFLSASKDELIDSIKLFLNRKHESFRIV